MATKPLPPATPNSIAVNAGQPTARAGRRHQTIEILGVRHNAGFPTKVVKGNGRVIPGHGLCAQELQQLHGADGQELFNAGLEINGKWLGHGTSPRIPAVATEQLNEHASYQPGYHHNM